MNLAELLARDRSNDAPEAAIESLLPALGRELDCDRVFLYLRSPERGVGRVPFCWRRSDLYPNVHDYTWKAEPESLPELDPMFAAALATRPSIFIEDIETAGWEDLNREFERETFGHRAVVHGHVCADGQLWGVLQPCVFEQPRVWSPRDRETVARAIDWLTPLAIAYVRNNAPARESVGS